MAAVAVEGQWGFVAKPNKESRCEWAHCKLRCASRGENQLAVDRTLSHIDI